GAPHLVTADAGGRVDARMAGEDDTGAGPALPVSGLLVLAEAHLGEGLVDVGEWVIAEEEAGEHNRELAAAAVTAPAGPAGVAVAAAAIGGRSRWRSRGR